jgi:uncharacterized protein YodC (DUF2158 family)
VNPEKPTTVGQVVQLKSGGPAMTIVEIVKGTGNKEDEALLSWFLVDGCYKQVYLSLSALLLVDAAAARKAWPNNLEAQ